MPRLRLLPISGIVMAMVATAIRNMTVSYTHLDVYKRQSKSNEEPANVAAVLSNLADIALDSGEMQRAEKLLHEALDVYCRTLGSDYPQTAIVLNNLGSLLDDQGKYADARSYVNHAIAIWKKHLGPQHTAIANGLTTLGNIAFHEQEYTLAQQYFEEAVRMHELSLIHI